jgi:penicillin-insensitive murein endopeptidase
MRVLRRLLPIAAAICAVSTLAFAATHGDPRTPSGGPTRVIGGPAGGCIAGAAHLPDDGAGFQSVRVGRNRHWGHPETVSFVERLGRRAQQTGLEPFYVGDMAQPRGGPMSWGHGSHQNGLDVDIWFNLDRKPHLAPAQREDVDLPSMVLADQSDIDRGRFGDRQVRLLRLAAQDPKVDRIFVHWTIKAAICEGIAGANQGDRSWVRKLRPWRGHDEHFHVRLSCPPDQPGCVGQAPIPPGDGCDESLEWWFRPNPPPLPASIPRPSAPISTKSLPKQCRAVFAAR